MPRSREVIRDARAHAAAADDHDIRCLFHGSSQPKASGDPRCNAGSLSARARYPRAT